MATVLSDPPSSEGSDFFALAANYGERKPVIEAIVKEQRWPRARESFIKFLITEIIVIVIEPRRMMFAWIPVPRVGSGGKDRQKMIEGRMAEGDEELDNSI